MAGATATTLPASVTKGLTQLSQIGGNLATVKAAGQVIVPVIAEAIALTPERAVMAGAGELLDHRYSVPHGMEPTDVLQTGPGVTRHLLKDGRPQDWADFVQDLPDVVTTLLEDERVQALSDTRRLEKLAHALDD